MAAADIAAPRRRASAVTVVLEQELRELVATNRALNFLEQRETVNLTLQVAVAVGALLALLTAADAVSGSASAGRSKVCW